MKYAAYGAGVAVVLVMTSSGCELVFPTVLDNGAGAEDAALPSTFDASLGHESGLVPDGTVAMDSSPPGVGDASTGTGDTSPGPGTGTEDGPTGMGDTSVPSDGGCACVPQGPGGWSAPFLFYSGPSGSAPTCPSGTTVVVRANADIAEAPAASCGACSCSGSGGACDSDPASLEVFLDADCFASGQTCSMAANCGESCSLNGFVLSYIVSREPTLKHAPTCTANTPTNTLPSVTWMTDAIGCRASGPNSCASGSICAPPPLAPFSPRACIEQAGSVSCPATDYTVASTFYTSTTDSRGCTQCTCGAASNAGCQALVQDCNGSSGPSVVAVNTCVNAPNDETTLALTANATGTCNATDGGTPMGSVAPASPVTICCMP